MEAVMISSSLSLKSLWMVTSAVTFEDNCFLERKLLKSKHITLPTKVHLVKAIVFLVVIYGCESWTIKKAEKKN